MRSHQWNLPEFELKYSDRRKCKRKESKTPVTAGLAITTVVLLID